MSVNTNLKSQSLFLTNIVSIEANSKPAHFPQEV